MPGRTPSCRAASTSRAARASARCCARRSSGSAASTSSSIPRPSFPSPDPAGRITDEQWASTLALNVTANYLLVDEAADIFEAQGMPAAIVLTSSANAVVPKRGSEAYDISKSAVSHLVRELAVRLAPRCGSTASRRRRWSADRRCSRATAWRRRSRSTGSRGPRMRAPTNFATSSRGSMRAVRCSTSRSPPNTARGDPLVGERPSGRTTGHIIPVDGGLPEAFLR